VEDSRPVDFAGYRDLDEIGRGRASTVFRAVQSSTGRPVAIKVLSVSGVEERLRRRFERELAVSQRLSGHPNIAEVIDLGYTEAGHPFLVTPYYEHGSLDDRLSRSGPLPVIDVVRIGSQLAGALAEVHRAGILHRDIKPSNVLEAADGEPALTGFGISAIDPAVQAMTMAQSFAAAHTPPEVILGQSATEAGDTYQLASTLYALLSGHAPFQVAPDDGIVALLGRIQSVEVPDIPRADIPPGLIDVLRWALAKDPGARPGPSALADALGSLHGRPPAPTAGPAATPVPVPPPAPADPDPYGAPPGGWAPAPPAPPAPGPASPPPAPAPPPPAPPVPAAPEPATWAPPSTWAPPGAPEPVPAYPSHPPDPSYLASPAPPAVPPPPDLHGPPPLPPARPSGGERTGRSYHDATVRYPESPTVIAPMPPPHPAEPARRGCGGGLVVALIAVALLTAAVVTVALALLVR
jgi:serine/threonine-protein kinase PknK